VHRPAPFLHSSDARDFRQCKNGARRCTSCCAAKASGNGYACDVDDDSGDRVDLRVSFSSGVHPSVPGAESNHFGKYEPTDRHDFRHGEIPSEAGHKAEVERLHAPALEQGSERPMRDRSSSAKEQASC